MLIFLATVLTGVVAGVLSGMFGIGGGIITTPAIRLFVGVPQLIAVGTPLVAIIPSALTGAVSYLRAGLADVRSGIILGAVGSVAAVAGAWLTRLVGGTTVLVLTAVLILYTAADMLLQVLRPPRPREETAATLEDTGEEADAFRPLDPKDAAPPTEIRPSVPMLLAMGGMAGLYSGFLGLGGGMVIVPLLSRWAHFPMKRAVGTSLFAIAVLAIPGTVMHAILGHIDWTVALGLTIGVVPGALVGARISHGSSDRLLRLGFAAMLLGVGLWLGVSELLGGPV